MTARPDSGNKSRHPPSRRRYTGRHQMRISRAALAGLIAFTLAGCFEGPKGERGEPGTPGATGAPGERGHRGPGGTGRRHGPSGPCRSGRSDRRRGPCGTSRPCRSGGTEQCACRSDRRLHRGLQQFMPCGRSGGVGDVRRYRPADGSDRHRGSGWRGMAHLLPCRLYAPRRGLHEALRLRRLRQFDHQAIADRHTAIHPRSQFHVVRGEHDREP
jgi:hypothetical protein